jgi:hypothetical protein
MGQQKTRHTVSGFFIETRTTLALLSVEIKKPTPALAGRVFVDLPPGITEPQRGEVILARDSGQG